MPWLSFSNFNFAYLAFSNFSCVSSGCSFSPRNSSCYLNLGMPSPSGCYFFDWHDLKIQNSGRIVFVGGVSGACVKVGVV